MLKRLIPIAGALLLFGTCAYATTNDSVLAPELRNEGLRSSPARERFPVKDLDKEKAIGVKVGRLRAPFVRNDHLVKNDSVKYLANVPMGHVLIEDDGVTYVLINGKGDDRKGWIIKEKFLQTRPARAEGIRLADAKVNYFKGKSPEEWKTDILTYEELGFGEIYENTSLNLRANEKNIEKIFVIDKEGNPEAIKVEIAGAEDLRINGWGDLEIETGIGTLKMTKPHAYQDIDSKRIEVAANYIINPPSFLSNERGQQEFNSERTYGFRIGDYDRKYPLIIDPLLASTFIGGDWEDIVTGIATDASGNIYITGYTALSYSNPQVNFPTTPGAYDPTHSNVNYDAFVAKFNPSLSTLLASTFFGGNGDDRSYAMKIDTEGNVFVAGSTNSDNLPTSLNAYMRIYERGDAFIAKFSSDLSQLPACTYVRANDAYWANEWLYSLAIDTAGNVYAAGVSDNYGTLPAGGYKATRGKLSVDAMIVKLTNDLSALLGATFLGGENVNDVAVSIALDSSGNVFVTGETNYYSEEGVYKNDFPVTAGAYAATYGTNYVGCLPSYIAKLNSSLSSLLAATYVGGPGTSWCGTTDSYGYTSTESIAVGSTGNVYVTGTTDTGSYPTTEGAYDRTFSHGAGCNNCIESFISKMDNSLSSLLASTYMGGNGYDYATTMTLDNTGNAYIAGYTSSQDYPTTPGADYTEFGGWHDGFVSKLNPNLTKLTYSSFLGGKNDYDEIKAVTLDPEGKIVVSGETFSSDFPVTQGAYRTTLIGNRDLFVTKLEEPKGLAVDVIGPKNVNPGQEATYLIRYINYSNVNAENVVVTAQLPTGTEVISATQGSIWKWETSEVFWELNTLAQGDTGNLSFKISIPWGVPNTSLIILAKIGASNVQNNVIDVDSYLNYDPLIIASRKLLTSSEITSLLNSNVDLKGLFSYAIGLNYKFYNVAEEAVLNTGDTLIKFYLKHFEKEETAVIVAYQETLFILAYSSDCYSIFDQNGGFRKNTKDGSFSSWGNWSVRESPSYAECVNQCMTEKVKSWILEKTTKLLDAASKFDSCKKCWYLPEGNDKEIACNECMVNMMPVPGLDHVHNLVACMAGCAGNTEYGDCFPAGAVRRECNAWWGWTTILICGIASEGGPCSVTRYTCNGSTGKWDTGIECCPRGHYHCVETEWAGNARCVKFDKDGCSSCDGCDDDNKPKIKGSSGVTRANDEQEIMCSFATSEVRPAHDPNAKSVDFGGNVIPGQTLTYVIEYENTGAGTAYNVFIEDTLDKNLDDTSLTIHNEGTYFSLKRIIYWNIGELAPGQKGSVSFSVNVKNGLSSGTEIVNYAEVNFPSADEVTPTNPVVNTVRSIAADPRTFEITSGTPLGITLTGRDSGSGSLNYEVTSKPLYGTLEGTPPNLTYTSTGEFCGQDTFYYVVNNGIVDSDPARVVIKVNPNPADANPPKVTSTYPLPDATNVHVSDMPLSTDPLTYLPTITATFSEPIDSSTITTSTFTVGGLTGTVLYDEMTRTASFIPSMPLSPSMTYTAQLTTGIKDKVGNSMAEDYSWQFSTESLQNIAVTLPDNASEVNFGIVRPHLTSKVRIVSISSTGIEDLVIDTISLSGSHTGDFTILEDKCSGTALTQFENCTARIKFSPSSKGLKQATLSISSNDPDTPTYDVSLKGIGARAKVLLLSPNGGEVIPSGSTETINWGVASGVSKVTLSYSMDGGKTWSVIGKNLTGTNRDWTVPSPTGNKKKCFIQVTGYSSKNKKVASDTSDAPFAIEVVKLTSPNGPEPLVSGSTQEISWEVNGTAKPVATIELFYTGDGGKSWSLIESLSGTDRSHEWTVPDIDKPKCKVKVLLKDEKGKPLGNDLSDNWFAIEP